MWRKNRASNQGLPCKGVDLNRNYDFLWSSGIGTSGSACTDVFKGSAAFGEPETRNVRHLLDTRPNIMCLADVHSYSELVLYPWGDDDNQSSDPAMNFANPAFDGQRGTHGTGYREYIDSADEAWFTTVGGDVRDSIEAVRGRRYTSQQGILLYPTSATVHDYAYSRHLVQAANRKVMGFTIETGREFQPPWAEAEQIIEEVQAGLVTLVRSAMCAAESILTGTSAAAHLDAIRAVRDDIARPSPAGQALIALFETHGAEIERAVVAKRVKRGDIVRLVNRWAKSAGPNSLSTAPVPADVVDAAAGLLTQLADGVSPGLRRAVKRAQRDLTAFRGQTLSDAFETLDKKHR
jgi:hypothetical protein